MPSEKNRRYLRTKQAAEYTGATESQLTKLRVTGGGPVYAVLGRRGPVVYDIDDLDAWVASKRRANTSDTRTADAA